MFQEFLKYFGSVDRVQNMTEISHHLGHTKWFHSYLLRLLSYTMKLFSQVVYTTNWSQVLNEMLSVCGPANGGRDEPDVTENERWEISTARCIYFLSRFLPKPCDWCKDGHILQGDRTSRGVTGVKVAFSLPFTHNV